MKQALFLALCLTFATGAFAQDFKTQVANELKAANFDNVSKLLGFNIDPSSELGKAYSKFNDMMLANGEKRLKAIEQFAKNKNNITPDLANSLIKQMGDFSKERAKIMSKMPKMFGKHLSPANLLTLMQYESKKQSIIDGFLARNIPFANQ